MVDPDIGRKINEYRTKKKLSIRYLAEKANISSSMLCKIEKGLVNPSLGTFKTIAELLEEPMFSFFLPTVVTEDLVLREKDRKKIVIKEIFPEKEDLEYQVLSPDLAGSVEMVLMKAPPQYHSPETEHIGEEVAYILEGEILFYLNGKPLTLYKGDSVKIPPYMKHTMVNQTDKDTIIIAAMTPPTF